jgi:hypothetical protein
LKRFKRVGKGRVLQLFPPLSTFREGFAPEALAQVIFSPGLVVRKSRTVPAEGR